MTTASSGRGEKRKGWQREAMVLSTLEGWVVTSTKRCPGCGCPLAPGADTCGRHACVEGVNGSPDYGELEAWLSRVESAPPART